jgi:thioredoxin 1
MKSMMKTRLKTVIIVAFVALVAGTVAPEQGWCANKPTNDSLPAASASGGTSAATAAPATTARRPKLLDLGATKCIPCKMMAPVLEKLKKDYAGRLEVEFIDVWQDPSAGKQYKIELIPTQIFYSDSGQELFRHVGFYGREDILAKWKELGVDLNRKPSSTDSVKSYGSSGPGNTKRD